YIAEPAVLVVATHARPQGLHVDGQIIPVQSLLDDLRYAANLRLLHFSACLLMQDPAVVDRLCAFSREARTAGSGYQTSVNWAASAIIESTLLEMILHKGLTPAEAAGQVQKLLPFATDEGVPGGAFPAAGFHVVVPTVVAPAGNHDAIPRRGRKRRESPAR